MGIMVRMSSQNPRRKRATDNPDHARRTHVPAPPDPEIQQRLSELLLPIMAGESDYYRELGLRNRLLNLPLMLALVLTMIWRQVPGVCTLQRMLGRERLLWAQPCSVSQASLSERFLSFPAVLFERVLHRVLQALPARLLARTRPQLPLIQAVQARFQATYALDGTTLEALFRKLDSLREAPDAPLAGHLVAATDLTTHLPAKLWWADDPLTNDKALIPQIVSCLSANTLLVFDLGYFAFSFFDRLTAKLCWFVTRLREKTSYTVVYTLQEQAYLRDQIVMLGNYRSNPSLYPVRLVELYVNGAWRRYLTNVLAPERLSVVELVALYDQRWQIETMFLYLKRLLGLAYLWVGSLNGVKMQVWATFLFYAVLIDLSDEVAEVLQLPLQEISVEMVYRSLYFYVRALEQGYEGSAAAYLAREAKGLGIIKRKRTRSELSVSEQLRRAMLGVPLKYLPALAASP